MELNVLILHPGFSILLQLQIGIWLSCRSLPARRCRYLCALWINTEVWRLTSSQSYILVLGCRLHHFNNTLQKAITGDSIILPILKGSQPITYLLLAKSYISSGLLLRYQPVITVSTVIKVLASSHYIYTDPTLMLPY